MIEQDLLPGVKRRDLSDIEMSNQVSALQDLVLKASSRLIEHGERHGAEEGLAAHFRLSDEGAILRIASSGEPDERSRHGLFLRLVLYQGQKFVGEVLSFQMPRLAELVSVEEALSFSDYTPQQLGLLTSLVQRAVPISIDEYDFLIRQAMNEVDRRNADYLIQTQD